MSDIAEALIRLIEAKKEHDEAREKCEYDWGYFGTYQIEQLERATKDFENELNTLIDKRIAEQITNH